jgi:heme-degrading monooxygenase HmoA
MKTSIPFSVILVLLLLFNTSDGLTQQLGDKVYWMSTTEVTLGNLPEYHAVYQKEMMPVMEKHGYMHVAVWQTIVGDIEQVIVVVEFENMAEYHKARRSLLGSEEWKALGKKFSGLSKSIKSRFLSAAPYSKLK